MVRLILVFILIFLLVRLFYNIGRYSQPEKKSFSWKGFKDYKKFKGFPKELGEYIDFEETRKKK